MKRREFLGWVAATTVGGAGCGGSSTPETTPPRALEAPDFYWGVGIENTWMAQTDPGKDGDRRLLDEYLQSQHSSRWREDLTLAAELGINSIRYSVPWYQAEPSPGEYDWSSIDGPVRFLVEELGIVPVLDLVHYGTPRWMPDGVLDPRFPEAVARYSEAMALHFRGLVNHYTPHNEPQLNAIFTGLRGRWPPYRASLEDWVYLGMQIAKGMVLQTRAIRSVLPDAVIISADTGSGNVIAELLPETLPADQRAAAESAGAAYPTSLSYGRVASNNSILEVLRDLSVSAADLDWLLDNPEPPDILGCNVYPDFVAVQAGYGDFTLGGEVPLSEAARNTALLVVAKLRAVHEYYGLPLVISETSAGLTADAKSAYASALGVALGELRGEGFPILGMNWWPLFDALQWDYREQPPAPAEEFIIPGGWNNGLYTSAVDRSGLWQRVPSSAAETYRDVVVADE